MLANRFKLALVKQLTLLHTHTNNVGIVFCNANRLFDTKDELGVLRPLLNEE